MPVVFTLPNGRSPPPADPEQGYVGTVLFLLTATATLKARKDHALPRKATVLDVLAAAARVPVGRLKPLTMFSSGIYTEEDYLAQFEEDWEREEYGAGASKVIAKNKAAWQPPQPLIDALDIVIEQLADPKRTKGLSADDSWKGASESLEELRRQVRRAADLGALEICLELDDEAGI
jgi:hypothetical protein